MWAVMFGVEMGVVYVGLPMFISIVEASSPGSFGS